MLVAIILGVLTRNLIRLPDRVEAGIAYTAKRILRIGVVLLGLQLVIGDVLALGPGMIVVVVSVVVLGLLSTILLGRALGMNRNQTLLIAGGFSICGAAAVAAVGGMLDEDDKETKEQTVTAVALVVIFGTLMIPIIPLLAHVIGLNAHQTGLWAGASVHEVAQVVAVGGTVGSAALASAVIVKLARVLMLAPVLTAIGLTRRLRNTNDPAATVGGKRPPIMPLFVAGFIAMVIIRSLGFVPAPVLDIAKVAQQILLAAAMFALGAGVRFELFRKIGAEPFILAASATVIVGAVGLGGVLLFG